MYQDIPKKELLKWCSYKKEELKRRNDFKVKLDINNTREEMMKKIGNMMADEIIEHNKKGIMTKWVLPAGPTDQYDFFIDRVNKERINLKNLWIFHMDEFLDWEGRPYEVADTYESLEGTMLACFYGRIDDSLNVPLQQRIWPDINNIDYADEMCEELGGIDTVWAGIGAKGLVAFCECPRGYTNRITIEEFAKAKTRIVDINDDTIVALSQRSFGCCYDRVPPRGITIGFGIITSAKRAVYMVATGTWKQTVVRVILFSEPTLEYPVTILPKYIPDVTLFCDEKTLEHPLSDDLRGW